MTKRWNSRDIARLEELKAGGHSWSEIAAEFGVSKDNARSTWRHYCGRQQTTTEPPSSEETTYEEGDDFINVVCASKRVLSKEDIVKQFNIDLDIWEIERFKVKTSEGYRKDRSVVWKVENGTVLEGDVNDTGKMLVVPLYQIEVRLVKKKKIADAKKSIDAIKEDAVRFAPKYIKINYPKINNGCLFEYDLFDVHVGRLTWDEESGENYDLKIAQEMIEGVTGKILSKIGGYSIGRILLPLGNDFFNVDNKNDTTVHGTPQQEDTRWQKTFRRGREICVKLIDTLSQIAPVDVLVVAGNHDEQRSFYLGDSLECWYHNSKDVNVDNRAMPRKYYRFGQNLIGFTHGYYEKLDKLPFIMAAEATSDFAETKYREWHTGDKHKKQDKTDESNGMTVRILSALAAADAWTFNKGYKGERAATGFIWDPQNGLDGIVYARP